MGSLLSLETRRSGPRAWVARILSRGSYENPFAQLFLDSPKARSGTSAVVGWIVPFLDPSDCCALLRACFASETRKVLVKAVTRACRNPAFLAAGFRANKSKDVEALLSAPFLGDNHIRGAILGALHQIEAMYGKEYLEEGGQRIECDTNALRDALLAILGQHIGENHFVLKALRRERQLCLGMFARHLSVADHCFDAVWALCRVRVADQDVILSGSGDNTTVLLWDPVSGLEIRSLDAHDDEITSLCADVVDQGRFWSGSEDGLVKVWDAASGECQGVFGPFSRSYGYVRALCCVVAQDASSLVLAGLYNGEIHTLEAASCSRRKLCKLPNFVTSITLIEFGRANVAVGCGDKKVRVIHSITGEVLHTLAGHLNATFVMRSIHPPRELLRSLGLGVGAPFSRLVSCSWDKTIRVWSLQDGRCIQTLEGHTSRVVGCVLFDVNGVGDAVRQIVASCSIDGTVKLWSVSSGECLASYCVGSKLFEILLMPDGSLAVGTENGRVIILDICF